MTKTHNPNTITLLLLTAFASVAAVLYTPALPEIMQYFSVNIGTVQFTMSIFLIAYALGPAIYGPLAHNVGRKKTLYIGISIGLLGMALCILSAMSHCFTCLVVGRMIEGFGTSVGLVMSLTIVSDVYTGAKARKIMSLTTLSFALLPGLAIFIGGWLAQHFSWVSTFYFSALYSIFVLLLCIRLPETKPELQTREISLKLIGKHYARAFSDKKIWTYTSMWGLTTAVFYLIAAMAPIIVINHLGYSSSMYGTINGVSYLCLIVGNFLSARLASSLNTRKTILLGILIASVGGLIFTTFYILKDLNLWTIYLSFSVAYIGLPLILANASAHATSHLPAEEKAYASAAMSMINMGYAVVVLMLFGILNLKPDLSLSIAFIGLIILELFIYISGRDQ